MASFSDTAKQLCGRGARDMKAFSKCSAEPGVNPPLAAAPTAASGASGNVDRLRRPRGLVASFVDGLGSAATIMDLQVPFGVTYRSRGLRGDWAVIGHDIRRAAKRVAQEERSILLLPERAAREVFRWPSKPTKRSGLKRAP